MSAYVILTREVTTNRTELDIYAQKSRVAANGHAISFLAVYGKHETLEGSPIEGAVVLQFPTFDDAKRWYDSPAYQEAALHRRAGGQFRAFIVEGVE